MSVSDLGRGQGSGLGPRVGWQTVSGLGGTSSLWEGICLGMLVGGGLVGIHIVPDVRQFWLPLSRSVNIL